MTLYEEIEEKCTPQEIADRNYHAIANRVNVNRVATRSRLISERGILESYPDGPLAADAVIAKLEDFAATGHPLARLVKRALKFLAQSEGLDIGSPATQAMLTQLGAGGVISVDEANKLKSIAQYESFVTWEDCQRAVALQGLG